MARCSSCGRDGFSDAEFISGTCQECRSGKSTNSFASFPGQVKDAAKLLTLTTETHVGEVERLGVVATEVVLGMNLFKDALANLRDIFGGRSGAVQDTLAKARAAAFDELRLEAARLGANAVIAIDIDYHSISTGSSVNMMIVSVSGTAVRIQGENRA